MVSLPRVGAGALVQDFSNQEIVANNGLALGLLPVVEDPPLVSGGKGWSTPGFPGQVADQEEFLRRQRNRFFNPTGVQILGYPHKNGKPIVPQSPNMNFMKEKQANPPDVWGAKDVCEVDSPSPTPKKWMTALGRTAIVVK